MLQQLNKTPIEIDYSLTIENDIMSYEEE